MIVRLRKKMNKSEHDAYQHLCGLTGIEIEDYICPDTGMEIDPCLRCSDKINCIADHSLDMSDTEILVECLLTVYRQLPFVPK